jgi:AAA+ ATPase superfamily predicted ATPase
MILEQIVKDILKEEYSTMKKQVEWDGMFDEAADRIVKEIRKAIVE